MFINIEPLFILLEEKSEKVIRLREPKECTFQLRDLSRRLSAHTESEELLVCQTTTMSET
jgi:hypothetical protein